MHYLENALFIVSMGKNVIHVYALQLNQENLLLITICSLLTGVIMSAHTHGGNNLQPTIKRITKALFGIN